LCAISGFCHAFAALFAIVLPSASAWEAENPNILVLRENVTGFWNNSCIIAA